MEQDEIILELQNWLGAGSINIFGLPFSGKDTQANKLAEIFNTTVIGGGEILRSSQDKVITKVIDSGVLAPTDDYLKIVLPFLSQEKYYNQPLILSSVGRWSGEEKSVIEALKKSKHELKAVVFLDIDEKEANNRWKLAQKSGDRGRRADDAHGKLDVRLREFSKKTLPVLEFYRHEGLLVRVDGRKPPTEVFQQILKKLYQLV